MENKKVIELIDAKIKGIEEDEKTFEKSCMYLQLIEADAAKIALLKLKIEIENL